MWVQVLSLFSVYFPKCIYLFKCIYSLIFIVELHQYAGEDPSFLSGRLQFPGFRAAQGSEHVVRSLRNVDSKVVYIGRSEHTVTSHGLPAAQRPTDRGASPGKNPCFSIRNTLNRPWISLLPPHCQSSVWWQQQMLDIDIMILLLNVATVIKHHELVNISGTTTIRSRLKQNLWNGWWKESDSFYFTVNTARLFVKHILTTRQFRVFYTKAPGQDKKKPLKRKEW